MASLYEIKNEYLNVLNNIEFDEETGEILNLEELENMEAAFEDKAEAVALYIKEQNALADAIKAEEKNLHDRRGKMESKVERLKLYLANSLVETGRDKFETPKCKLSFRKSVSVEIADESLLPKEYLKETITYKPDKTLIKEDISNGVIVDGASLIEKRNLQIK